LKFLYILYCWCCYCHFSFLFPPKKPPKNTPTLLIKNFLLINLYFSALFFGGFFGGKKVISRIIYYVPPKIAEKTAEKYKKLLKSIKIGPKLLKSIYWDPYSRRVDIKNKNLFLFFHRKIDCSAAHGHCFTMFNCNIRKFLC
jgi:hypothetical protein